MVDTYEKSCSEITKKNYQPLHPEVYKFCLDAFDPEFLEAIHDNQLNSLFPLLDENYLMAGIFVFPFFKSSFCAQFVEECENLEKHNAIKNRPNSMNKYGFTINDIGFEEFTTLIMKQFITPMTSHLFGESWSSKCETNHSFVVKYSLGEDIQLKDHKDISDITLNVCLGKSFTGSKLHFYGRQSSTLSLPINNSGSYQREFQMIEFEHRVGTAILHLGQHVHGVDKLTSGQRWNLVMWSMTHEKMSSQM